MPAIYILDIPEFEPILRTALIAGMEQEDLDGYLRVSTSESEIVLERRRHGRSARCLVRRADRRTRGADRALRLRPAAPGRGRAVMTVQQAAERVAADPWPSVQDPAPLLPDRATVRMLGTRAADGVDPALLRELHRQLVIGRRFNEQATALTRQGQARRLPVEPRTGGMPGGGGPGAAAAGLALPHLP